MLAADSPSSTTPFSAASRSRPLVTLSAIAARTTPPALARQLAIRRLPLSLHNSQREMQTLRFELNTLRSASRYRQRAGSRFMHYITRALSARMNWDELICSDALCSKFGSADASAEEQHAARDRSWRRAACVLKGHETGTGLHHFKTVGIAHGMWHVHCTSEEVSQSPESLRQLATAAIASSQSRNKKPP